MNFKILISNYLIFSIKTEDYSNQSLIRIFDQNTKLNELIKQFHLDAWTRTSNSVDIRVNSQQLNKIKNNYPNLKHKIVVENIQSLIDKTEVTTQSSGWFSNYHSYKEIKDWYMKLSKKYPQFLDFVPNIGKTTQGRDIFAIHIKNKNCTPKKRVWFQSLIHAREWITGSTLQYVTQHLLFKLESKDPKIKNWFNKIELIIIPIVNPDGYEITRKRNHRLWRKNAAKINGRIMGVDLNRNFPSNWGEEGASNDPADETYRGSRAASEPETQAITNYYKKYSNSMVGAIDFHCYGQLILRPYGHTRSPSPDETKLLNLSKALSKSIYKHRSKYYKSIKGSDLYKTSGTADDWFYSTGHRTYAYTFELSPTQNVPGEGFILPPSQIIPVGKEIASAVEVFLSTVIKNPL